MSNYQFTEFLTPLNVLEIKQDEELHEGQIGKIVKIYDNELPDINDADIIIIGCGEERGNGQFKHHSNGPDIIRKQFYSLYYWHSDITLVDIGNVKIGETLADTLAALKTVVKEIISMGKKIIMLGGSHDLTLAQFQIYKETKLPIEVVCVDALLDLNKDSLKKSDNFLLDIVTSSPKILKNYNHVGFQSYLIHPNLLEIFDNLKFNCHRVGWVKEFINEVEPIFRTSHLVSFDLNALAHTHSPASRISPNGFTGEEACMLSRFAGMSSHLESLGVYNYYPELDTDELSAKQIAHILWYFIEGYSKRLQEASFTNTNAFNEFHLVLSEIDTLFLQSKRTGRWWMRLPDKNYLPCSHNDYLLASKNEIPERWLRAMENV